MGSEGEELLAHANSGEAGDADWGGWEVVVEEAGFPSTRRSKSSSAPENEAEKGSCGSWMLIRSLVRGM